MANSDNESSSDDEYELVAADELKTGTTVASARTSPVSMPAATAAGLSLSSVSGPGAGPVAGSSAPTAAASASQASASQQKNAAPIAADTPHVMSSGVVDPQVKAGPPKDVDPEDIEALMSLANFATDDKIKQSSDDISRKRGRPASLDSGNSGSSVAEKRKKSVSDRQNSSEAVMASEGHAPVPPPVQGVGIMHAPVHPQQHLLQPAPQQQIWHPQHSQTHPPHHSQRHPPQQTPMHTTPGPQGYAATAIHTGPQSVGPMGQAPVVTAQNTSKQSVPPGSESVMPAHNRCSRHVAIAYYIYYQQRASLMMQGTQGQGVMMDPTLEARRLKERSEWLKRAQQQQQQPDPAALAAAAAQSQYLSSLGYNPQYAMYAQQMHAYGPQNPAYQNQLAMFAAHQQQQQQHQQQQNGQSHQQYMQGQSPEHMFAHQQQPQQPQQQPTQNQATQQSMQAGGQYMNAGYPPYGYHQHAHMQQQQQQQAPGQFAQYMQPAASVPYHVPGMGSNDQQMNMMAQNAYAQQMALAQQQYSHAQMQAHVASQQQASGIMLPPQSLAHGQMAHAPGEGGPGTHQQQVQRHEEAAPTQAGYAPASATQSPSSSPCLATSAGHNQSQSLHSAVSGTAPVSAQGAHGGQTVEVATASAAPASGTSPVASTTVVSGQAQHPPFSETSRGSSTADTVKDPSMVVPMLPAQVVPPAAAAGAANE